MGWLGKFHLSTLSHGRGGFSKIWSASGESPHLPAHAAVTSKILLTYFVFKIYVIKMVKLGGRSVVILSL